MQKPDAIYKFRLSWDEWMTLYRLDVISRSGNNWLMEKLLAGDHVMSYYDAPRCEFIGEKGYLVEVTRENDFYALFRFAHNKRWPFVGMVFTTEKHDDCVLFTTDHQGFFEVFVFNCAKAQQFEYCQQCNRIMREGLGVNINRN